ncbi:MAG: polymer-forming cytoskeletal protein [Acidobacteria bacterium]|nr:polymer-forming cytoskeletal protein [Acidobacteriota bacterium]
MGVPPLSASSSNAKGRAANIGTSLFIKGEVSGSEDLTVEGRVEGRIDLKDHNITIAASGRVNAEIHAKSVIVVGEVNGNINADDKVEIADTGRLTGDIHAPRVAISDGAQFRGSVDMVRDRSAAQSVAGIKERVQAQVQTHAQSQTQTQAASQGKAAAAQI